MSTRNTAIIFYLSFISMELSYIYLFTSFIGVPLYVWLFILVLYLMASVSRLLGILNIQSRIVLTFGISMALLILVGTIWDLIGAGARSGEVNIASVILRLLLGVLIWFMGYTAPIKKVSYLTIIFRVQIGILVVIIFSQMAGNIVPVVIFFTALTAVLFFSRWVESSVRDMVLLRGPNIAHFTLGLLVFVLPSIFAMLIFSPNLAMSLVSWFYTILSRISDWLYLQHQAASKISGNFKFDFSCNMRPEESLPQSSFGTQLPAKETADLHPIIIWIVLLFVLVAIVTLIVMVLRRRNSDKGGQTKEKVQYEVQSLQNSLWKTFTNLFIDLIKRIWLRLKGIFLRYDKTRPIEQSLLSIRALYRSLINWAAKKGISTKPSLTPLECLELIKNAFPDYESELRDIINAYLIARYSRNFISEDQYNKVRKAWSRLAVR